MINERIERIEAAVNDSTSIPESTRRELAALLADLKAEVAPLNETHGADAQSIAGFTDASVHEAMRTEKKPELADAALKGLASSARGFEVSHPRLVAVIDRIALTLSNMGI
ncbi:MAG TPA: DUF4404 family protein [Chthoniobacteraceae bacterium]|jgi:hypothetical protein|nr:putative cytosolic protein [Chthoniobacter sp.]HEV7868710.1 DUF4404 family protein [Chthoniobacteraceae bacterium]